MPTGQLDGVAEDPPRPTLVTAPFVLVTAATFAYFMAIGAMLPTLPRFVEDELGGGSIAVGVVVGAFAVSAALLRPLAGRLGDVRGRRLLVVGGALLVSLSALGYAFAESLPALIGLRLLTGAGEAAVWIGAATAIQDMAPDDRRGEAASYFSVALYAGLAFGPFAGEWLLESADFDAVWFAASGVALLAAVLGWWTPAHTVGEPQPFRLFHPAALRPGSILFLGLLPFVGFSAFVPLYGPTVGLDDVAPLFLLYGLLVLVVRVVGARLPDRLGWERASRIALGALGFGGILLGVWAAAAGVWVTTVALAMGMSLLFPALFAATVAATPESERGLAVGTFSLFFDGASGLAPPLLGVMVSLASYRVAFAGAGVIALAGILLISRHAAGRGEPAPHSAAAS